MCTGQGRDPGGPRGGAGVPGRVNRFCCFWPENVVKVPEQLEIALNCLNFTYFNKINKLKLSKTKGNEIESHRNVRPPIPRPHRTDADSRGARCPRALNTLRHQAPCNTSPRWSGKAGEWNSHFSKIIYKFFLKFPTPHTYFLIKIVPTPIPPHSLPRPTERLPVERQHALGD